MQHDSKESYRHAFEAITSPKVMWTVQWYVPPNPILKHTVQLTFPYWLEYKSKSLPLWSNIALNIAPLLKINKQYIDRSLRTVICPMQQRLLSLSNTADSTKSLLEWSTWQKIAASFRDGPLARDPCLGDTAVAFTPTGAYRQKLLSTNCPWKRVWFCCNTFSFT